MIGTSSNNFAEALGMASVIKAALRLYLGVVEQLAELATCSRFEE